MTVVTTSIAAKTPNPANDDLATAPKDFSALPILPKAFTNKALYRTIPLLLACEKAVPKIEFKNNERALSVARIVINARPTAAMAFQLLSRAVVALIIPLKAPSLPLPMSLSITSKASFKLEILPWRVSACISCIL